MTITEYLDKVIDVVEEDSDTKFDINVIIDNYTTWVLSWEQLKDLVAAFPNHNIVIRSVS